MKLTKGSAVALTLIMATLLFVLCTGTARADDYGYRPEQDKLYEKDLKAGKPMLVLFTSPT